MASVSRSGLASAVPKPVTVTVRASARPAGSLMPVPPVMVPPVHVAAGLQAGMPLEGISRRRIAVPHGRPGGGREIEKQEGQPQAARVLGAVPFLMFQERAARQRRVDVRTEDD